MISKILSIFQGIGVQASSEAAAATSLSNSTSTNAPSSSPPSNAFPTDISSLIALFLSIGALRDWIKLIVIGGFFETCRRLIFSCWSSVIKSFWLTVEFDEGDDSFNWMMVWLSQQPSWGKARDVAISTCSYGLSNRALLIPGEEEDEANGRSDRKLAYLPSFDTSQVMWYDRHYMRVARAKRQEGVYSSIESLILTIFTRDVRIVNKLLLEAKKAWKGAQEHHISIYAADSGNNWRNIASRPKRPLRSIVLDEGLKELLIDDAHDFLESKSWYADRGIPFRRGYLLYGAPGSGKTSIIHSLAGELGLNVYIISLSRFGLDDRSLQELISELPEHCIALMEDIDAAFTHDINRKLPSNETGEESKDAKPETPTGARISLSGLLNALDGVGAQEGRLLFATTNRYKSLDAALCRPGRMDLHIEFKLASSNQACELFKCFHMPAGYIEEEKKDEDEESVADSGYGTPSVTQEKLVDVDPVPPVKTSDINFVGSTHKSKAPKLSHSQVKELAQQFADAIPEREFSMAELQGYLMTYKTRPFEAVSCAGKWIADQRIAKAVVTVKPETAKS